MEGKIAYKLIYAEPHRHFVDVELTVSELNQEKVQLQLPAWRPGRYELGNFAKNVQRFAAFNASGQELKFRKLTKDLWEVNCSGQTSIRVEYNYFASELNAGSTYVDQKQLYVNPVNCCMYVPEWIGLPATLQLEIPENWTVASGMTAIGKNHYQLKDFHELADSPFIASAGLQHNTYQAGETLFHIWFQGEFKTEWERILDDFKKFTSVQVEAMGDFPVKEYHFLFQIRTYKTYHGVEHSNSTVVALGPSYDILKPVLYDEFLGISSHELFHTWNVKALRPIEMLPYDYTKENYTRLGYVAEGVTTYAGDLFLYQSGCFSDFDFFKNIHTLFQRHFHNYGRFNLSVADSGFDTWLDGYQKGIPDRKTSIYNEGALLALMLDISLLRDTNNQKCLMTAMRLLYERFGKTGIGYTEKDYQNAIEEVGGRSYEDFFKNYYYGTCDLEADLNELLHYVGLEIRETRSRLYFENRFGFKVEYIRERSARITEIAPNSIADRAGLKLGDEIVSMNGIRILGNLKEWCKYFQEETVTLTVNADDDTHKIQLTPTDERYYRTRWPHKVHDASDAQKANFSAWTKRSF
ncbi:MAG: PDZ domain-containing protein [Flavobacteriales bacterium]|nr:PDZ domain-containing protein [Flavobacteriales bacterium]